MPRRVLLFGLAGFFALAGCSGGGGSGHPETPVFNRGVLKDYVEEGVYTTQQLAALPEAPVVTAIGGAPQCSVAVYRITYSTIGAQGEPADASAGVLIPQAGCRGPYPLLSFAQGTNIVKLPPLNGTYADEQTETLALVYASRGYVAVATDYLGLGLSSYPFHPYLHAATEAAAIVYALRAARNLAQTLGVSLSGQVMLAGASEGGHATLAAQREIEANDASEFSLAGVTAASGPYDLLASLQFFIKTQDLSGPVFVAYLLPGYQKIYGNLYGSGGPSSVFRSPYDRTIDSLFPLQTAADDSLLKTELPTKLTQLLQPSFLATVGQAGSPVDTDLAENSLLSGWTPVAPVYLCGASTDPVVTYQNATEASAYFKSVGADASLVDDASLVPSQITGDAIHAYDCLICDVLARANFLDTLRTGPRAAVAR